MPIRAVLFLLAALTPALPATAQEIEANEALLMRLIFDDCVGFVKDGLEPFKGLETDDLNPEEREQFKELVEDGGLSIQMVENRTYVAVWGKLENAPTCLITPKSNQISEPLLTVRKREFIEQATLRALAEGLVVGTSETNPEYGEFRWVDYSWVGPGDETESLKVFLSYEAKESLARIDAIFVVIPPPDAIN